jgi:branched-chain amino acid transport system ATP-binding protein
MLDIQNLAVSFGGVAAVRGVSLRVQPGEFVGLIGPNGAGKTTLLRMMTGVLSPDRGQVQFRGQDITRLSVDQRARMGLVMTHQIVRPFRQMSLLDNALLAAGHALTRRPWLALWHTRTQQARERAQYELQRVGIAEAADKLASQVPLGYLKRLQVAMALALDPQFLMLDEPLAGLNYHEAERFSNLLTALHRDGLSLLLVEHNLGEVMRVVTRLVVIDSGTLIGDGPPQQVMAQTDVRQAYLGHAHA